LHALCFSPYALNFASFDYEFKIMTGLSQKKLNLKLGRGFNFGVIEILKKRRGSLNSRLGSIDPNSFNT